MVVFKDVNFMSGMHIIQYFVVVQGDSRSTLGRAQTCDHTMQFSADLT